MTLTRPTRLAKIAFPWDSGACLTPRLGVSKRRLAGILALALVLLVCSPARAMNDAFGLAGHVTALRQWVESGNPDAVAEWLSKHFDAPTMAGREDVIEAYFVQTHRELQGGRWSSFRRLSDHQGQLFVSGAAAGEVMLTFDFAAQEPHGITQLRADIELNLAPEVVVTSEADLVEVLDGQLTRLAAEDAFSGAVLLARGDRILYERAVGEADKTWSIPNRTDTRFNLASMSKIFTGVMACRLMSEGLIEAGDSVGDYLPDWPQIIVRNDVTIHHLLTHSSGLGSYWNDRYFETWDRLRTVPDFLDLMADQAPTFTPGRGFQYSNSGYLLLGRILEVAGGRDFEALTHDLIYRPAGMHQSGAFEADVPVAGVAQGYTFRSRIPQRASHGERRSNIFQKPVKGGPAGGTYATVRDLYSFSRALLDGRLLEPHWLAQCTRDWIERPGGHYAYGFQIKTVNSQRVLGHTGGSQGVDTALRIFPDSGYVVVILSNYDRGAQELDDLLISGITYAPLTTPKAN